MWRASQHAGCSERASEISGSPRRKRSCSSRCSTTSAKTESHGVRRGTSRRIFGSRGRTSARCRFVLGIAGFSSSMSPRVRVERRGTSSATRARPSLSTQSTGWKPQTCQIRLASPMLSTCRPTWPEGRSTYVRRSAHVHRLRFARPAHRPERAFPSNRSIMNPSSLIGRLAARCPAGEAAQGEMTLGARQHAPSHLCRCSRSCRVPAALADDGEVAGCSRPPAGRRRRGGSAGYQRELRTRVADTEVKS